MECGHGCPSIPGPLLSQRRSGRIELTVPLSGVIPARGAGDLSSVPSHAPTPVYAPVDPNTARILLMISLVEIPSV
jgi:hypothetical protein